jgi:origin recognition complex subunit 4
MGRNQENELVNTGEESVEPVFSRRGKRDRKALNEANTRTSQVQARSSSVGKRKMRGGRLSDAHDIAVVEEGGGQGKPLTKMRSVKKRAARKDKETVIESSVLSERDATMVRESDDEDICIDDADVPQTDEHIVPSPEPVHRHKSVCHDVGSREHMCRWLTKSLAHPLSMEAKSAGIRPSLQKAVDFIQENVRNTIEKSFNNSILVIGAPGSGKSLAVSRVCMQVDEEWNTDKNDPQVGIVRLSGWAFSDEKASFREIARQLCEKLHLDFVQTASYGENIQFLLAVLKALAESNKSALFILEDFDLFAHSNKQTFLYCLLDSLQKSHAQAMVIGTTCRYDCLNLLEKRVKSRFSHRNVILTPPISTGDCQDKNSNGDAEDGALAILESMLQLPEKEYPQTSAARKHNKKVHEAVHHVKVSQEMSKFLESSNSLRQIANIARKVIAMYCTQAKSTLSSDMILKAFNAVKTKSLHGYVPRISRLSVLDLTVLVSAYKAHTSRADGLLNFEMIHHEFRSYATSGDHVDNYSKVAASKAFEHLMSQGIITFSRERSGPLCRRDRNFASVLLQITRQELIEGLKFHKQCPMRLREWCTKEGGPRMTATSFL